MLQCWEYKPEMRPTFSGMVETLSHFLESVAEYMELSVDPGSDATKAIVLQNSNLIEV